MTSGTESTEEHDERALAAEYVLGVLTQGEREQVKIRIDRDEAFRRLVDDWEDKLSPLAAEVAPVRPPVNVWNSIESTLFDGPAVHTATSGWWSSLAVWRGLAFAAVLLTVASGAYQFLAIDGSRQVPKLTATLQSEQTPDKFVAAFDQGADELVLTALNQVQDADRDYELWLIEGSAAPISLGVVPGGRSVRVNVPEHLRAKLAAGNLLAVSLEPSGGSTTGAPTGPVVAAGKIGIL